MANIVKASMIHTEIISSLHSACFKEFWNEKSISEILNMAGVIGFIISTGNEKPEGFILLRAMADEAEIISIGVIPTARKKGLASALLKKSIESAAVRDATKIFIEVAENNKAAIAFYETFGFKIVGKRPGYYKRSIKKEDAIIYSFNITNR